MNYEIQKVSINAVHLNPRNPRKITDDMFEKLKDSINKNPKMLAVKPILVDENYNIIGGNMRYLALQRLNHEHIFIMKVHDFTEEEKKRAVIIDNLSYGFWDFEMLGADYEQEELEAMGFPAIDTPMGGGEEPDTLTAGKDSKKPTIKVVFENIDDLGTCQPLIEEVIAKFSGATLSVSAGEL